MILTLSNVLSLSRAGLALAFLHPNVIFRLVAIVVAMITDFLDGFLARRLGTTSQLGAVLDPIMDKFFVFFVGGILYLEGKVLGWQLGAMISRDVSLCIFGLYLGCVNCWKGYEIKAIWWGKISTSAQFLVLIGLTINIIFPPAIYLLFVVMAGFAFIELFTRFRKKVKQ